MAAKRRTVAEKRRASQAYRREATATLVLLARLRGMVGDALVRSTGPRAAWTDEPVWRQEFQAAFEELQARLDLSRESAANPVKPGRRRKAGDLPELPSEEAREMMRGLYQAIQSDRARQTEATPTSPAASKLERVFRDFEEAYERAELCDKISEQVTALMREVEALRDLSGGTALAMMLGGQVPRGAS